MAALQLCHNCGRRVTKGVHCSVFISSYCRSQRVLVCDTCFHSTYIPTKTTTTAHRDIGVAAAATTAHSSSGITAATAHSSRDVAAVTTTVHTNRGVAAATTTATTKTMTNWGTTPVRIRTILEQSGKWTRWSESRHPTHRFPHHHLCGTLACRDQRPRQSCDYCIRHQLQCAAEIYPSLHTHVHHHTFYQGCGDLCDDFERGTVCCWRFHDNANWNSVCIRSKLIIEVTQLPKMVAEMISTWVTDREMATEFCECFLVKIWG